MRKSTLASVFVPLLVPVIGWVVNHGVNAALNVLKRVVALFCLVLTVAGCSNTKSLPGGFELLKWEDGSTFYVIGPNGKNKDGGGAIEGTVQRIAWNKDMIAAERYSTFRGDKDGWMIIDVKTKKVSGPMSDDAFSELRKRNQLQVMSAADAWGKL